MVSNLTLIDYLEKESSYLCLNILESALVCCRKNGNGVIPEPLLRDLADLFDCRTLESEIKNLLERKVLIQTGEGISLNREKIHSLSIHLNQLKKAMKLTFTEKKVTAGIFLNELVTYLEQEASCLVEEEANDCTEYLLVWRDNRYRLQLAFSPGWLPAVADEAAADNIYFAVLGPFAAQNWQKMLHYYGYPAFRNNTAYYDPWHHQKMNISKGGLFSYFDWFFRDRYGSKFFIPDEFPCKLHSIGLLRYNDEK
ncbi:MAG: hypothetical protein PHC91_05420 [Eubacteriales bacterium]|nr:hypothetical protein [Eubacteriales bacterium]